MSEDLCRSGGQVAKILQEVFGFSALRFGQEDVVSRLLEGDSTLALFPTGAGKSLCYQLPALLWSGLTLVVSPLLALMRDQVEALQEKGIAALRLDSTLNLNEVAEVYEELQAGKCRLLYVSPERFGNERFLKALASLSIEMIAVDEAHCLSEWGHNFRPDYLKLAKKGRELGAKRWLALTATATVAVAKDIQRAFDIADENVVRTPFERPNLSLRYTACSQRERDALLAERLQSGETPAIVYVTQQRTAEAVAAFLRGEGIQARAYHGGMRPEGREEVEQGFRADQIPVVVATIAFGMGIDKGNIRAVYHYNLPKSVEGYVQETGRAGRNGEEAVCEALVCLNDLTPLENFAFGDTPDSSAVRAVLRHLLQAGAEVDVDSWGLEQSCDVKPAVLGTILARLEMGGWLVPRERTYTQARVKLVRKREDILLGYDPTRRKLLRALFEGASEHWGRLVMNFAEAAASVGQGEEEAREAVSDLARAGDAAVRFSGRRQRYARPQELSSSELISLGDKLVELQEQHEERELARLDQLVSLFELNETGKSQCIAQSLAEYFGEQAVASCGKCSVCLGEAEVLPGREEKELSLDDLEELQILIQESHPSLQSARQLARFLCGLRSPAAARARLFNHRAFGLFEEVPFLDVLVAVEALGA